MVNEERVKLMTKLAVYENTKGKKQLNITKYYQSDYVRFHVMKTGVLATLAYALIITIYVVYHMEAILEQLNGIDYKNVILKLGLSYAIFTVALMVIAHFVYTYKYNRIKPDVREYYHNLKELKQMYEDEEEQKEKRAGRSLQLDHDNVDHY